MQIDIARRETGYFEKAGKAVKGKHTALGAGGPRFESWCPDYDNQIVIEVRKNGVSFFQTQFQIFRRFYCLIGAGLGCIYAALNR